MGYYTKHSLEVLGQTDVDHEEEIFEQYGGVFEQDTKWYSFEGDMQEYSKKYPDLIFKVEGLGEEPLDYWIAYFKNGKMQMCPAQITFDEYDESKLK